MDDNTFQLNPICISFHQVMAISREIKYSCCYTVNVYWSPSQINANQLQFSSKQKWKRRQASNKLYPLICGISSVVYIVLSSANTFEVTTLFYSLWPIVSFQNSSIFTGPSSLLNKELWDINILAYNSSFIKTKYLPIQVSSIILNQAL